MGSAEYRLNREVVGDAAMRVGSVLLRTGAVTEALAETLNAATSIKDLLFPGVKGMASRADFQVDVFLQRRTGFYDVAAAAGRLDLLVLWMDVRFHCPSQAGFSKGAQFSQMPQR